MYFGIFNKLKFTLEEINNKKVGEKPGTDIYLYYRISDQVSYMKKKIIIEEMTCEYCASQVMKSLLEVQGVNSVVVNMAEKYTLVELTNEVSDEKLILAVEEAECKVVEIKNM